MSDVFKTVTKIRLCEYDTTAMVILEHRDEKMRADERERIEQAIDHFFGENEHQNVWKDTLIKAIKAE